jgi:PAS domain S-box-containing protein
MDSKRKIQRNKIIGLGENSFQKSYYPELQSKIGELETSYENLQVILNSVNDAILIHDELGKLLYINKYAEKLYGISADKQNNYSFVDLSSKSNPTSNLFKVWKNVISGDSALFDWVGKKLDTDFEFPVQVSINPTKWYGVDAIVAVVRDFTDQKKFEQQLIAAKEKAEENDRLKTAFLKNISHEIRTPMNAIIGFSDVLDSPQVVPEKRKRFLQNIKRSSKQLLDVFTDILSISLLETKQTKVFKSKFSLNNLMHILYEDFFSQKANSDLQFKLVIDNADENSIIFSDKQKIRDILNQLLSNSFKFTASGVIEFGYRLVDNTPEFFVRDTGIGIDKESQEIIFDSFRQSKLLKKDFYRGTGLGLAIVKGYIELLDGKIEINSELKKGTEFVFSLPCQFLNNGKLESNTRKSIDSKLVLIAEDEEVNYLYLENWLVNHGLKVKHAINGEEAIEFCKNDKEISLVLMDIKMPIMSGDLAAEQIRQLNPELPIIAQTAYATNSEITKYGDLFDDYITKPFTTIDLYETLKKYIPDLV